MRLSPTTTVVLSVARAAPGDWTLAGMNAAVAHVDSHQDAGGSFGFSFSPAMQTQDHASLFASPVAAACTKNWDGGAGTTSWDDPANWAPDGVPAPTDVACIGSGFTVEHSAADADSVMSLQSSGTLILSGGTLSLTDTANASTATILTQSAGTLGGAGTLSVSGSFSWTGGEQTDAGTTVLAAGASGAINAPSSEVFLHGGRTLQNNGTLTWSAGAIGLGEGARIENAGTLDATGDDSINIVFGGAAPLLHNTGTLRKSAGSGTTTIGVNIDNDGSLRAESGTISLFGGDGGATETGSFGGTAVGTVVSFDDGGSYTLGTGATLPGRVALTNATVAIPAGTTVPSSSVFTQSGGTLGGAGTLSVSGSFSWTGGEQTDAGTTVLAAGASGAINAPSSEVFLHGGRTLQNNGTLTWSAGAIGLGEGARIENAGTLDATGDDSINIVFGGAAPLLHNTGTFKLEASSTVSLGVTFVQAASGTFATTIDANANAFGHVTAAAGVPVSLDGLLRVTTVGSPAVGSTWPIISGADRSGQFATLDFGSTSYEVQYPADGVMLRVGVTNTLSVLKNGSGAGTVTSSPAGIDCGSACSASFTAGTTVTLTASAAAGSVFAGWSGGGCSGTGTCTVTIDQDQTLTATFDLVSAQAPLAPGYWKNHQTQTMALLPIALGSYTVDTFAKATAVFDAMNCSNRPSQNAIGCLAGQLLAAKLNVKNGASTCIAPTIANADIFLSGGTVNGVTGISYIGPSATYSLTAAARSLAIQLKDTLETYNNGGGC